MLKIQTNKKKKNQKKNFRIFLFFHRLTLSHPKFGKLASRILFPSVFPLNKVQLVRKKQKKVLWLKVIIYDAEHSIYLGHTINNDNYAT